MLVWWLIKVGITAECVFVCMCVCMCGFGVCVELRESVLPRHPSNPEPPFMSPTALPLSHHLTPRGWRGLTQTPIAANYHKQALTPKSRRPEYRTAPWSETEQRSPQQLNFAHPQQNTDLHLTVPHTSLQS